MPCKMYDTKRVHSKKHNMHIFTKRMATAYADTDQHNDQRWLAKLF